MKVVVMWEEPDEEDAARRLTDMMVSIVSVSLRRFNVQRSIKVRARCCPANEEMGLPMAAFRDAAERAAKALAAQAQIPPSSGVPYIGRYPGVTGVTIAGGREVPEGRKPVVPLRKPPKETRELIFPEDDHE